MPTYAPTIGLEIHIELKTKTKMFCGCFNVSDEKEPNKNICPVCLAHPGTLPTINYEAVREVVRLGLALNGIVAEKSHFDRKSYFYPDLPKGYQISQYEEPIVKGGILNNIRIRRIHLEEDTGKLVHSSLNNCSLIDFNRAGVPLMELVTEPDIKTGDDALNFAKELQLILRYLNISDADMEKGQMRIEVNVSVSDSTQLGIKVEVKNLNSFKAVGDAIQYEIKRLEEILSRGEQVIQETRGWDDNTKKTKTQRIKEEAHDYRYFPEPDLPQLNFSKKDFLDTERLKLELSELPQNKRERFQKEYSLSSKTAEVLVQNLDAANYFEQAVSELKTEFPTNYKLSAKSYQLFFNYLTSDLFGLMKEKDITFENLKITPENFSDLVALVMKGELSSRMAKNILAEMQETGEDPRQVIERKEMKQVSDEETIIQAVKEVLNENPKPVSDYKKGMENSLQFLIGKTMAKLKGKGNPLIITQLLEKELTC